jgi:hypothetical protein
MNLSSLAVLLVLGSIFLPFTSGAMQIEGMKFNDSNAYGFPETGEAGLGGWTITLMDPNMTTTVTAGNGTYKFTGLTVPGTYIVSETAQAGWLQTGPTDGHYMVDPSLNNKTQADFGNAA